jgi:hypothetical protein
MKTIEVSDKKDLFYPNKKVLRKNGLLYHINGKIAWDGVTAYYPNEQTAFVNKHLFHPNGNIAWDGKVNIGYDEEGLLLSKYGVAVKLGQGLWLLCNKDWVGVSVVDDFTVILKEFKA